MPPCRKRIRGLAECRTRITFGVEPPPATRPDRISMSRLLFLAHLLPYPPDSGAGIRTFNILRLLARDFEVTALCFYRIDPSYDIVSLERRLASLRAHATVDAVPIPQQGSRLRLIWDHARSVALGRPYTHFMHESGKYDRLLARTLRSGGFDLVHVDSLDLSHVMPRLVGRPVVCTHHNVESALLRRRANGERRRTVRAYLRLQARLMEGEERRWLGRVALNLAVSPDDERQLRALSPSARVATVPNGVDVDRFAPSVDQGALQGSVFVGGTGWYPNRDGLQWFVAAILPELVAMEMRTPVRWVGHVTEEERRQFEGASSVLEFTGYVEDIRPHVAPAACFIVPLRVGGGTRLKVLDAWAMGKAVVSTTIGCEGLDARHEENILIADEPKEFARCVARVHADPALRQRLGAAGRRTVEERYSWDVVGSGLRRLYRSVLPSSE